MNPSKTVSRLSIVLSLLIAIVIGFILAGVDPSVLSKSLQFAASPNRFAAPGEIQSPSKPPISQPADPAFDFDLLKRAPAGESQPLPTRYRAARARACQMPESSIASQNQWTNLGPGQATTANPCRKEDPQDEFRIPFDRKPGAVQFRHGAIYPNGLTILGGGDNGLWRGERGQWSELLSGAGGFIAVNRDDSQVIYAARQGLALQKSEDGGRNFFDASKINDTGLYAAPFAMDPNDPQRLWAGGRALWRTADGANQWTRASANIAGSSEARISAIAVAPANFNIVLAGTSEGRILRTNAALDANGQTEWPSTQPRRGFVSSIAFDPRNEMTVYATYSTFGGAHIWRSDDGGASWTPIDGAGMSALPDVPVHTLAIDTNNPARLFAGTDLGIFVTIDGGASWTMERAAFGAAVVESLAVHGAGEQAALFAFTRGAGVWRLLLNPPPAAPEQTCTYTIAPASMSFEAAGAQAFIVRVTAQGTNCSWNASSGVPWVTFTTTFPVTGNGEARFNVAANTTAQSRGGKLVIAGRDFNIAQAGTGGNCRATPIAPNTTVDGALTANDCPTSLRTISGLYYADRYGFDGRQGDRIAITMSSQAFEPDLLLVGPTGAALGESPADVSNRTLARIPRGGLFFTLPATGAYVIEATSDFTQRTGNYRIGLTLTSEQCGAFALAQSSQLFEPGGGAGAVQVIGAAGCPWTARLSSPDIGWVTIVSGTNGVGNSNVQFTVAPNSGTAQRRATLTIGGQTFAIEQAGLGGNCGPRTIAPGATVFSSLSSSDCLAREQFTFTATAGQAIIARAASLTNGFFPIISLFNASGINLGVGAGLLPSSGVFNIPAAGQYTLEVRANTGGILIGDYAITLFSLLNGCGFTATPAATSFSSAAAQSSIAIATNGACPWQAVSEANWITINSASTGTGNGEIKFSVAENFTGASRRGSVTISGRIVTIDQAGVQGACPPRAIAAGQTIAGTISAADCVSLFSTLSGVFAERFTFSGKAGERLTINDSAIFPASGSFLADANGNLLASGLLGAAPFTLPADGEYLLEIIARPVVGASVPYALTLGLTPPGCSYSLSPRNQRFDATGGEGEFKIATTASCAWRAVSGAAWVTVDSSTTMGSGDGAIKFRVAANADANARRTVVHAGGQNFTIEQSGPAGRCLPAPIEANRTISATLSLSDCTPQPIPTSGGVGVADRYSFAARAGEQILAQALVTPPASAPSGGLSILLNGPTGALLLNATGRLPASGFYTLPADGNYTLEIATANPPTAGSFLPYTVDLQKIAAGCSVTLSPATALLEAGGGQTRFNVATAAGCDWRVSLTPADASAWLSFTPGSGTGPGTVDLTIAPNTSGTFRRAALLVGDKTFLVDQAGAGASCGVKPIVAGQTVAGSFTAAQCRNTSNMPIDRYSFAAQAGEQIALRLANAGLLAIVLRDETGSTVSAITSFTPFRLPFSEGFLRLPRAGAYSIEVGGNTGVSYTIALEQTPGDCAFTLDQTSLTFLSAASSAPLKVVTFGNCLWYAESHTSWIKLDKSSGQGNGAVIVSVEANTTQQSRSGSIYVAGRSITVFQNAPAPPCASAPIALGQTVTGTIASGDCLSIRSTNNNTILADRYALNFSEGQQFAIEGPTISFEPFFIITDLDGIVVAQGSRRVPAGTGFLTLPAAGAYTIEVSGGSFSSGSYQFRLTQPTACAYSLLPASRNFEAAGGAGGVKLVAGAACAWTAAGDAAWIAVSSGAPGTGSGEIRFNVAPNAGNNLRRGAIRIGDQTFAVTQAGSTGSCAAAPIALDQLVMGSLTRGDCPPVVPRSFDQGLYADTYSFTGEAGARFRPEFSASPESVRAALLGPNGLVAVQDLSPNQTYSLPASGRYTVELSSRNVTDYTLRLRPALSDAGCIAVLNPTTFPIFEAAGGQGAVSVSSLDGCASAATSDNAWITVTTAPGKINFTVAENFGESRFGSIRIANRAVLIAQAGKGGSCLPQPIAPNQAVAGAIDRFDCPRESGGGSSVVERFTFDGKADDQVALHLLQGLNLQLSLFAPNGAALTNQSNQTRQPATGFFKLPATGPYTIELSGSGFQPADYRLLLSMVPGGCGYTLSSGSQTFEQAGGAGSAGIKAGVDCPWLVVNAATWVTLGDGANGKGDGTLNFTVAPNTSIFARRTTLLIGGQPLPIAQAGLGGVCQSKPIVSGQTVASTLDESDCFTFIPSGARLTYETYTFEGKAGDQGLVQLSGSSQIELALFTSAGNPVSTGARFTLPADGQYLLRVGLSSFSSQTFADYRMTLLLNSGACTFAVAPTSRRFEAAGGEVAVTVATGAGCVWNVANPANWITLKSEAPGAGPATVTLVIAENRQPAYRGATLTIAGNSVFIEQAGTGGSCVVTALTANQPVNGTLSRADCPARLFGNSADRYSFAGKRGDQVAILLSNFLTLSLWLPDGRGFGNTSAAGRLPQGEGYLTLPVDGEYTIDVSGTPGETAQPYNLTLQILPAICNFTVSTARLSFGAAAGTGVVQVQTTAGCSWLARVLPNRDSSGQAVQPDWITIGAGATGAGAGEVRLTVAANATANYRNATLNIAGRTVLVEQAGTGGNCTPATIVSGQTVSGTWAAGDCPSRIPPLNYTYADVYQFTGTSGSRVAFTLTTTNTSSLALTLVAPNGAVLRSETVPRLPGGGGFLILPASGVYQVQVASSFSAGSYMFNLNLQPICGYTVTPSTVIADAAGGRIAATVAAANGCDWLAASNAPWISVAAADSFGSGTGLAQFTVEKNPGTAPRMGVIRVANQNINATQAGPNTSVSSASLRAEELASGSLASAFGVGLATTTLAPARPATNVGGTTVRVRDSAGTVRDALIFFVSPGQVNYQVPPATALGKATALITAGNGVVTTGDLQIVTVAPGLFTANASGSGLAAGVALRVRADGTRTFEPIFRIEGGMLVAIPINLGAETDEVFLLLFGTGINARTSLTAVKAAIGGVDSPVLFAGPQGDAPGFDQVNIRLPRSLAGKGEVDVVLMVDGKTANTVKVNIL